MISYTVGAVVWTLLAALYAALATREWRRHRGGFWLWWYLGWELLSITMAVWCVYRS